MRREMVYRGEPVALKGRSIWFTSWKYVRQGGFVWRTESPPVAPDDPHATGMLGSDGTVPARFEPRDIARGIRLVVRRAEKVPFAPGQRGAQVFEDGVYKAWYAIPPCVEPEPFSTKDRILPGQNHHVCYAESDDGFTWREPALGICEYAGSRRNNVVFRGDLDGSTRGWHGGTVFVDPSSTDERYKMLYLGIATDDEWDAFARKYPGEVDTMARRRNIGEYRLVFAVFGAVSPDGLYWTSLPEPLAIQHADTQNTCYYDVDRRQYVAYVRVWQVNEISPEMAARHGDSWIGVGRRSIGRMTSDDFRHFSPAEIVAETRADMPPSHLWYTNGKTTLPDAPDQHVMFPWRWELERDGGDVWLLSSADGVAWSEVPGGPVITCGPIGGPDGGYIVCSGNLFAYGDRWGIPYSGASIPHKYPGRDIRTRQGLFPSVEGVAGLAMWPKGRLVGLECAEEGAFATVGLIPPGERITLNAIVPPTGHIEVVVSALDGGEFPGRSFADCDRIIGDGLALPVTWKGDGNLGNDGAPIVLRFRVCQATLFGIEFM